MKDKHKKQKKLFDEVLILGKSMVSIPIGEPRFLPPFGPIRPGPST